jgi:hypothetical protein
LAILLLGVSALLGVVVLMNIYVAVATAYSSELSEMTRPNYVLLGAFAVAAITCLVGGIMMLRHRGEES